MLITLFFVLLQTVQACEVVIRDLPLVYPKTSTFKDPVQVQLSLEQEMLVARFTVHTPQVFAQPILKPNQYPFQFDVVEVFVSVEKGAFPYYEFELSPFDQTFDVKILAPNKSMVNGIEVGAQHSVTRSGGDWTAEIQIPLRTLGWGGDVDLITGNAFAVLGPNPTRSYYSLFLPAQNHVNFHQAQYFKPLVGCQIQ